MNKEAAADRLNNSQYRNVGSKELFAEMKAAGLVAVFGYSDDCTEFEGAIRDEQGCSKIYVDRQGVMASRCDEGMECPYFLKSIQNASYIQPKEGEDCMFIYDTNIPHSTFNVFDDDDPYCIGIVFNLDDLA